MAKGFGATVIRAKNKNGSSNPLVASAGLSCVNLSGRQLRKR
jgi:hypothetical protein